MQIVTTKDDLKRAVDNKESQIIVKGELANSLYKAKIIATLGVATIALLTAGITAMPFTGGVSSLMVAPVVISTGLSADVIIAVIVVGGVTIVLAITKDYNISVKHKSSDGSVTELELRRK